MSKRLNREHKYQVWITSYPLDGASEASKYDPGHQLVGMHENITQAVLQAREQKAYEPVITKIVTYQETITDVTDLVASGSEANTDVANPPSDPKRKANT